MRESRSYGSVRGALGNERPYRDPFCLEVCSLSDRLVSSTPE
jgi:hypothetical protein